MTLEVSEIPFVVESVLDNAIDPVWLYIRYLVKSAPVLFRHLRVTRSLHEDAVRFAGIDDGIERVITDTTAEEPLEPPALYALTLQKYCVFGTNPVTSADVTFPTSLLL